MLCFLIFIPKIAELLRCFHVRCTQFLLILGYGVRSDGKTVFVNASVCDLAYNPSNKPIVFDVQIPDGYDKA